MLGFKLNRVSKKVPWDALLYISMYGMPNEIQETILFAKNILEFWQRQYIFLNVHADVWTDLRIMQTPIKGDCDTVINKSWFQPLTLVVSKSGLNNWP